MRNKLLFLGLFLMGTLTGCKDTEWVDVPTGTPPDGSIVGKPGESGDSENPNIPTAQFINSSYIRGDFFEISRVSGASMAACTDLIYLTARPYANGKLTFDLPENTGKMTKAFYKSNHAGRSGVLELKGEGKMNAGDGLLHSADGPSKAFTFGTYVYLTEWVKGAYLFHKANGNINLASLQLGDTEGTLKLTLAGTETGSTISATAKDADLKVNTWVYVGVTFDKGVAHLYAGSDNQGTKFVAENKVELPTQLKNTAVDFIIGENLKGYLDETFVSSLANNGTLGKKPISFETNVWNNTKVLAYWKYDDAQNSGKDYHSWVTRLEQIRAALSTQPGERKLRLGVAGGDWKKMVANEKARAEFAKNVSEVLKKYHFDGVDLDFEWAETTDKMAEYSKTIVKLRSVLGKNVCFTVTLHPIYYKISQEAIAACDFISMQCYGPRTTFWSFETFKQVGKEVMDYGFPKEKLVMGLPFYGVRSDNSLTITAYRDLVEAGLNNSSLDEYEFNGKMYTLNSQNTIRKKVQHVCSNKFAGVMSWDLATDVDITHDMSLQKVVKEELDAYAAPQAQN